MSNDSGQNGFMRQTLGYIGSQICAAKRYHRTVEFTIEASLALELTVESLQQQSACLRISMLESQARIGDGPNDDYLALIEAHKAIEEYARRIFPDVTFCTLESGLEDGPEPDGELNEIIATVNQLVDGLDAITA